MVTKKGLMVMIGGSLVLLLGAFLARPLVGPIVAPTGGPTGVTQESPTKKISVSPLWGIMDFPDLVKESDMIIIGSVVQVLPSFKEKGAIGKKEAEEACARGEQVVAILFGEEAKEVEERAKKGEDIGYAYQVVSNMEEALKSKEYIEKEIAGIFTNKLVKIDECLKGSKQQKVITVIEQGGQVGNEVMEVIGLTPLKGGDKVLLFLKQDKCFYWIRGGPQGRYYLQGTLAIREDGLERRNISELKEAIKSAQ